MKKSTTKPRMTAAERKEWDAILSEHVGTDREILAGMVAKLTKRERDFLLRTIRHFMRSDAKLGELVRESIGRTIKNLDADAEIRRLAAQGKSSKQIADALNELGIVRPDGKPYTAPDVRRHCNDHGIKLLHGPGRPRKAQES